MMLSKRLVRTALSVSKARGLGSSYGLIDHRPFPCRQISKFTNHSKNSQMETLQDPKISMELDSEDDFYTSYSEERFTAYHEETERIRAEVEKMRTEGVKPGSIHPPPYITLFESTKLIPPENFQERRLLPSTDRCAETAKSLAMVEKMQVMLAKVTKLQRERAEVMKMRRDHVRRYEAKEAIETMIKRMEESDKQLLETIQGLSATIRSTGPEMAALGIALVFFTSLLICAFSV